MIKEVATVYVLNLRTTKSKSLRVIYQLTSLSSKESSINYLDEYNYNHDDNTDI